MGWNILLWVIFIASFPAIYLMIYCLKRVKKKAEIIEFTIYLFAWVIDLILSSSIIFH